MNTAYTASSSRLTPVPLRSHSSSNDNRFTIADYEYERDDETTRATRALSQRAIEDTVDGLFQPVAGPSSTSFAGRAADLPLPPGAYHPPAAPLHTSSHLKGAPLELHRSHETSLSPTSPTCLSDSHSVTIPSLSHGMVSLLPTLPRSFDPCNIEEARSDAGSVMDEKVVQPDLENGRVKRREGYEAPATGWNKGNILWRFNNQIDLTDSSDIEAVNQRKLPIYLIIFGLAHLWQLVLTVIALRTKNTIQVVAVTAFNFAFLGYAVIQIQELREVLGDLQTSLDGSPTSLLTLPLNVLTAVIIAVVSAGSVLLLILTYLLRREFGWQRYRFLGADLQIRKYYLRFQVFECICYFSAFFCAGFGIQFIWLVLQRTDAEYVITWVMFPVSILLLVIGRFAAKYEHRPFMAFFSFGLLLGIAYFIFKLVRIWQQTSTTYKSVSRSLTVFDALSLLSLLGCLVWGGLVWRDFGKGLKEAVLSKPSGSVSQTIGRMWRTRSTSSVQAESEMSVVQKRLTIS